MAQVNPPVSVKINPDMKNRLDELAKTTKRTRNWLINAAVDEYVSREERRAAYRKDAKDAFEEYQQTGLHLRADEADEWFSQLERGDVVEPPKCHK